MNYAEARLKTIRLLNQYSNAGNLIPSSDGNTLDFTLRFPTLFDACQKEIATTAKYIHRVKRISQNPIPNLLPTPLYTFNILQHLATDLVDMAAIEAKSYYFEVDGVADIYIEEQTSPGVWTNLATIHNTTPKGQYSVYKGFTGVVDPTHTVRVRFSGSYPYNIRNRALFAYLFPTTDDIPNYVKYVQYTMPSDFYMLNRVVQKGNTMLYTNTVDWQFEGRNVVAVNYFLIGEIDVFYYAYPATIDDTVADAYIFEIDEEAAQAMPYYVASQCLIDDPINKSVSDKLYAMYQGKLANLVNAVTQGSTTVKNSMFTGDGTNKLF